MLKTYYYSDSKNFGDLLTPYILETYNVRSVIAPVEEAQVIGIGSIMDRVTPAYTGALWTTGSVSLGPQMLNQRVKIYALRGVLSQRRVQAPPCILGDGGLLVHRLARKRKRHATYKLALVPHIVDYQTVQKNVRLSQRPDVLLINLREPVHKVLADIDACDAIASSSLHGLIAGDALGKPTIQFRVSTSCRIIGGSFKYEDYYSAFEETLPEPLTLCPRTKLEDVLSRCILRKDVVSHVQARLDQTTRTMCSALCL